MDRGLIVDVETTGLDANKDKIIEIGICEFGWTDGVEPMLLSMYSALEDPGIPLDDEIIKLTGLTDSALSKQAIDWRYVADVWDRASIVIAHNASFDRDFLKKTPTLSNRPKHWACSVRHIDWESKGFGSRKLQYLAADHGFVNPFAHRALFDCATTFRLVSAHLKEIVELSYEAEVKFLAVGSPFESKDILRTNHYRWDAEQRVWHKTVTANKADSERKFLGDKVYKGSSRHVEEVTWFNEPTGR